MTDKTDRREAAYTPLEERNPDLCRELADTTYACGYVEEMWETTDDLMAALADMQERVKAAEALVGKYREALEHYADKQNWLADDDCRSERLWIIEGGSGYTIARAALGTDQTVVNPVSGHGDAGL